MKKHESKPEQHQIELDFLTSRLWRKRSLYRMRGFFDPRRWGHHPIEQTLDEAENVTQAEEPSQERATDLKIFEQTLAQLRSRGFSYAEEILLKMSRDQYFTLPHEQFPQDELVPYTVLMFQPQRTIAVLEELKKLEPFEVMYNDTKPTSDVRLQRNFTIAKRLCELLPSFERLFNEEPWVGYHEVLVAYINDVVSNYPPLPTITNFSGLHDKYMFSRYYKIKEKLAYLNTKVEWNNYSQMIPGFVFYLQGDSADILGSLGGHPADDIATWHFWLPRFMTGFKPGAIWFDKPKPHLERDYATPFGSTTQELGWRPILIPDSNGACSQAELYLEA